MKNLKAITTALILSVIALSSCKKDTPEPVRTSFTIEFSTPNGIPSSIAVKAVDIDHNEIGTISIKNGVPVIITPSANTTIYYYNFPTPFLGYIKVNGGLLKVRPSDNSQYTGYLTTDLLKYN